MSKTIVITGASSGVGAAAARALHRAGHRVVIVGRAPERTESVARQLGVPYFVADYARLDDVRRLAADLDRALPRIDVLANNAGGVFGERAKTVDGFEKTFQVNHLAGFLLTTLLMNKLVESRASVIQTSSVGARLFGKIVIDDLDNDRDFSAARAYGTAKLENILFTTELHRRYGSSGIAAAAFHPGFVASNFASESKNFWRKVYESRIARRFMISPDRGAAQLVWLATARPGVDWQSGVYYEKGKAARRLNPQVRDADLARQLWERSETLLAVRRA